MRVLFVTFNGGSHFYSMVPLGWALAAAGHEVRVAAAPSFAGTVAAAGLVAVPVGDEPDLRSAYTGAAPGAGRGSRSLGMFLTAAEAMAGELRTLAGRWRPHVIVYGPRAYAGVLAAAEIGVPAVRHLWGIDFAHDQRDRERPQLDAFFQRHGAADVDPFGALTVDPCPPSLQLDTGLPVLRQRYVPYNGLEHAPGWALRDAVHDLSRTRRACVTWGTTFGTDKVNPVEVVSEGLAGLSVEVVVAVTAAQRDHVGALPPGVRVVADVPLHLLLPHCGVVVHHGGAGTNLTAVSCGVPQLTVPARGDHPLNAERIVHAGVGRRIALDEFGPATIGREVWQLLDDVAYREAAARVRAEVRAAPAPAAVVVDIERIAGR
ncbi:MAG TPA: nucleotide disphospho-sugar-binding domain-containing protein [Rugosimonospora sp.]|nr:nucleotide disphospho-sugar-binding domain-containing protein [Rugosimonospora sp.]